MTLEEAEWIARNHLPDEPRPDEISSWRASRPRPEPVRHERGLDTMPAEPVDWSAVIRGVVRAERDLMTEAIGGALAEYGDGLGDSIIADVERMIAATAAELKEEFARQIAELKAELSGRIDQTQAHSAEVKAEVEKILARRKRTKAAKANGEHLLLPPPLADASLAPGANGNGDGHQ
jgi:hypothetical protein